MDEPILEYVLRGLRESDKPLHEIAKEAGVPYFTVQKWKRRKGTKNPRVDTVQKLANYFRAQADTSHSSVG